MKNTNPVGLFDFEHRLNKLSKQGDPLEQLNKYILWEEFSPILNEALKIEPKGKGGRPPFDYVMMFKILVLKKYFGLSDDNTEYQILDRISFCRFLGIGLNDAVPDSKTIWLFSEKLGEKTIEQLFKKFNSTLTKQGVISKEGNMVDASFVEVPRQRNSREENAQIKQGESPKEWDDNPNKKSQKDTDARWTKKNGEKHYGYKNHTKVDKGSKIIKKYKVTDASVHDSQTLKGLINKKDKKKDLWADSAYSGEDIKIFLKTNQIGNKINEKGYRNKPLTEEQKLNNKEKSKVRARVEHVYGFVKNSMQGFFVKTIGIKRAKREIGIINLVYNFFRYIQIIKINANTVSSC